MASFASINNVDDVWVPTEENPKEIDRNDNVWADVAHITGIGGSVGQLSYTTAAFAIFPTGYFAPLTGCTVLYSNAINPVYVNGFCTAEFKELQKPVVLIEQVKVVMEADGADGVTMAMTLEKESMKDAAVMHQRFSNFEFLTGHPSDHDKTEWTNELSKYLKQSNRMKVLKLSGIEQLRAWGENNNDHQTFRAENRFEAMRDDLELNIRKAAKLHATFGKARRIDKKKEAAYIVERMPEVETIINSFDVLHATMNLPFNRRFIKINYTAADMDVFSKQGELPTSRCLELIDEISRFVAVKSNTVGDKIRALLEGEPNIINLLMQGKMPLGRTAPSLVSEIDREYAEAIVAANTVDITATGETTDEEEPKTPKVENAPNTTEPPESEGNEEVPKEEPTTPFDVKPDVDILNPFGPLSAKLEEKRRAPQEKEEAADEESSAEGSIKSEGFDKGTLSDYEEERLSQVGADDELLETPPKRAPPEFNTEPNFTNEENLAANDDFLGAPELEDEYEYTTQIMKMQHEAKAEELRRKAFPDPLADDDDAPPEAPKVSKAAGKERMGPIPNTQFSDDSDDEERALEQPAKAANRPVTRPRVAQPQVPMPKTATTGSNAAAKPKAVEKEKEKEKKPPVRAEKPPVRAA